MKLLDGYQGQPSVNQSSNATGKDVLWHNLQAALAGPFPLVARGRLR